MADSVFSSTSISVLFLWTSLVWQAHSSAMSMPMRCSPTQLSRENQKTLDSNTRVPMVCKSSRRRERKYLYLGRSTTGSTADSLSSKTTCTIALCSITRPIETTFCVSFIRTSMETIRSSSEKLRDVPDGADWAQIKYRGVQSAVSAVLAFYQEEDASLCDQVPSGEWKQDQFRWA